MCKRILNCKFYKFKVVSKVNFMRQRTFLPILNDEASAAHLSWQMQRLRLCSCNWVRKKTKWAAAGLPLLNSKCQFCEFRLIFLCTIYVNQLIVWFWMCQFIIKPATCFLSLRLFIVLYLKLKYLNQFFQLGFTRVHGDCKRALWLCWGFSGDPHIGAEDFGS